MKDAIEHIAETLEAAIEECVFAAHPDNDWSKDKLREFIRNVRRELEAAHIELLDLTLVASD